MHRSRARARPPVRGVGMYDLDITPPAAALPCLIQQRRAQIDQVNRREFFDACAKKFEIAAGAGAEEREVILELQMPDAGELEVEQSGLARVGIDGIDAVRRGKCVIQRVAARAGDHEHVVVGTKVERLAVDRGVFPASVVNERLGVDRVEQPFMKLLAERSLLFDERPVGHMRRNVLPACCANMAAPCALAVIASGAAVGLRAPILRGAHREQRLQIAARRQVEFRPLGVVVAAPQLNRIFRERKILLEPKGHSRNPGGDERKSHTNTCKQTHFIHGK
jgi:hypothetical protein